MNDGPLSTSKAMLSGLRNTDMIYQKIHKERNTVEIIKQLPGDPSRMELKQTVLLLTLKTTNWEMEPEELISFVLLKNWLVGWLVWRKTESDYKGKIEETKL